MEGIGEGGEGVVVAYVPTSVFILYMRWYVYVRSRFRIDGMMRSQIGWYDRRWGDESAAAVGNVATATTLGCQLARDGMKGGGLGGEGT